MYKEEYLNGEIATERLTYWRTTLSNLNPGQAMILGCNGDEIIGFAFMNKNSDDPHGILLDNLHVYVDYKGNGIGTMLVRVFF